MHDAEDHLSENLIDFWHRLRDVEQHKIAIFGQPGSGKSSLLTSMVGKTLDNQPLVGIETDKTSWCNKGEEPKFHTSTFYTFIDVPGYGTQKHPADIFLELFPFTLVDVYIFVISGKILSTDKEIFQSIDRSGKPFCIVRNFSENLKEVEKNTILLDIRYKLPGKYSIFFSSNRTKRGPSKIYEWIHSNFGN